VGGENVTSARNDRQPHRYRICVRGRPGPHSCLPGSSRPADELNHAGNVTPAHPAARQPGPKPAHQRRGEEIIMPARTPHAGPAPRQARATAQLMIALDLTIVTVALPHIQAQEKRRWQ